MKKKATRILACFMACVIAFNMFAIPKAKASAAVVGTSALATSALASYMTATGVPLTVVSGGAAVASAGTASLISGYAAATGATYEVVTTAIAAGATISGGTIILGAAAVAVLAGIVAWAIAEYGVEAGSEPVLMYSRDGWYLDGEQFPVVYYTSWRQCKGLDFNRDYTTSSGNVIHYRNLNDDGVNGLYLNDSCIINAGYENAAGYVLPYVGTYDDTHAQIYLITYKGTFPSSCSIVTQGLGSTSQHLHDLFGQALSESVSISADADYEPLPELETTKQLRIETGVSPELAPEAVPDAIFESIAGNEFAPTYTEESVTSTDPNPDDGTGTNTSEDTGLLRRIAIACETLADKIFGAIESLADKIKEGFAEVLAPDPELMQEISEAFTDKFGFVSDLHRLGTDLLSIDATSAPPVVYIHLEDAEGSIYYGETVKALDMSWYARYKPDVDRIMSGFLWIGFLWLLFKRAAAIIRGAEMVSGRGADSESLNALEMFKADHNLDDWGRPIQ